MNAIPTAADRQATAKHTPGPWKVDGLAGWAGHKVCDVKGKSIASFPSSMTRPVDERDANAALIAASPRILNLLQRATHELEQLDLEEDRPLIAECRAALAEIAGGAA